MFRKSSFIVTALFVSSFVLSSCNLPVRKTIQTQPPVASPSTIPAINTPTPVPSLCDNLYFPNAVGDSWEYSGNNTAMGAYTRTDTISNSGNESFTVQSKLAGVSYSVDYSCTAAGLIALDPIQQYLGALLASPNTPVKVNLTSNSGISLPAKINPGDSWQQIAGFEGSLNDYSTNGTLVFDYSAGGYESITVPFGTFNALRVDTTIQIKVTALGISAGTYTSTFWMAPNVGVIKSIGTSHVPNVDFSDSLELTAFASIP